MPELNPSSFFDSLGALKSVSGRFVMESGPYSFYTNPNDWQRHSFTDQRGTRPDLPINGAALQEIAQNVSFYTAVSELAGHISKTKPLTYGQFYDFCILGKYLPVYLTHRKINPVEANQVPNIFGHIAKACLGMDMALSEMLRKPAMDSERVNGEYFYGYVDQKGMLIGESDVCAAPKHMILETVTAVNRPSTSQLLVPYLGDPILFRHFSDGLIQFTRALHTFTKQKSVVINAQKLSGKSLDDFFDSYFIKMRSHYIAMFGGMGYEIAASDLPQLAEDIKEMCLGTM